MSTVRRLRAPARPLQTLGRASRTGVAAALLAAAMSSACSGWAGSSGANDAPTEHRCPQAALTVIAEVAADATQACDGATAALAFLAMAGTTAAPPIVIEVAARLPAGVSATAIAAYSRRTGRITVLQYDRFLRLGEWFKVPIQRDLYRSLFAHEVAHAAAMALSGPAGLDTGAHEYIAYVAMFATMTPALRERVLARFDEPGFSYDQQINSMVYAFDPEQFGVDAWRHFAELRDRTAFLRRVLDGQALREPRPLGD